MKTDPGASSMVDIEPLWCAAANVKKEILFGQEHIVRKGTRHFRGGAKVYIVDAHWGMCNSVTVIGHHRATGRYIKIDIHVKRLEKFRLELVYSPKVIALIDNHFGPGYLEYYTREYAEKIVASLPLWIENYHKIEENDRQNPPQ
jgi:hypothetical protein